MFKTVRAKLILSYVAIVALFLLLALGGSLIIAQDISRASTLGSLHEKSAIIDPLVQFEVNNSARPIAQTMLARLRDGIRQAQVRVLIVNGDTMTVQEDTSLQNPMLGGSFRVRDASAPDLYTAR